MDNFHFYMGQIGLFLGAGSGIALMHILSRMENRPGGLFFIAVYAKSAFASIILCQPHLIMTGYGTPPGVYYFFLMFGIERSIVLVDVLAPGRKFISMTILRTMTYIGAIFLTFAVGWAIYSGISYNFHANLYNRRETVELTKKVDQVAKVAISDTTRRSYIVATLDRLLSLRVKDSVNIETLKQLREAKDKQINDLSETVASLTRLVTRLTIAVERQRQPLNLPPARIEQQQGTLPKKLNPEQVKPSNSYEN